MLYLFFKIRIFAKYNLINAMKFLTRIFSLTLFLIISSCSSKQIDNRNETHDKTNDIDSTAFVPLSEFMSDIDIHAGESIDGDIVFLESNEIMLIEEEVPDLEDELLEELPEEEITPEEAANKLGKGIQAEIILPNGQPITLMTDNSIKEWNDGIWEHKKGALELYSGEGIICYTIIWGYLYLGSYDERTGNCCVQEWDDEDQSFYEYCYQPIEKINGKALKSLKWYSNIE